MQLLLQCARPDALWRLRAALLRALAPPALPSTVAAAAEEEAAAVAAAAVAAAAAAAAEREVAALAAAMSAAKLEVLRLQERAYTLAQQRRLFDSGGGVSLAARARGARRVPCRRRRARRTLEAASAVCPRTIMMKAEHAAGID